MKKFVIIVILLVGLFLIYSIINKQDSDDVKIESQDVQDNSVQDDNGVQKEGDNDMNNKINIRINEVDMSVTLEDNATAKALLNKLPLEFMANELNGNEKYYYLDEDLPSNPQSVRKIEKGDIMLFGNDCLVIFYESFDTTYSYTKIGKIDDPSLLDNIGSGSVKVSINK